MNFARRQLEKYGWSDGKGLGKHENGIAEALKPKLKRSVAGVGHDAASDFTEHWWETLYDKAATNIQVENRKGRTKKIKVDDAEFQITNCAWKLKKKQVAEEEVEYQDYFVRTAILTNGGAKVEEVKDSGFRDDDSQVVVTMTDEQLFAACNGRTAHKGARHGLRALGKLARIEQQEKMLLTLPKYEGYSHVKKIKLQTNLQSINKNCEIIENLTLSDDTGAGVVIKKIKKKERHCKTTISCETNTSFNNLRENVAITECSSNVEGSQNNSTFNDLFENENSSNGRKGNDNAIVTEHFIENIEGSLSKHKSESSTKIKKKKKQKSFHCGASQIPEDEDSDKRGNIESKKKRKSDRDSDEHILTTERDKKYKKRKDTS